MAQPPLYKVKHGRAERYLKDDHELKAMLLQLALDGVELRPGATAVALDKEAVGLIARDYLLAEAVIDRLARVIDAGALRAMLDVPPLQLGSLDDAARSAESLRLAMGNAAPQIIPARDPLSEGYRRRVVRELHG